MSTNIRFKRSDIPGKVPSLEALELGELAINSADGKLFTKQEIKQPAGFAAIQKIVEIGATAVPNVLYVSKGGDDSNSGKTLGESFASVKKALSIATPGTTIFLKSGEYIEDNPLRVPARVSIVGDNLRNTTVRPKNPTKDIFWVYNGAYIFCMNFKGHIAPSAAVCFPPDGSAGEIVTSPYTQAVTSITTTGTGMRVDGAVTTGLRSMVVDAFTQYNQGGVGIHMLNRGNTQLVSVFTICCDISFLCESGGFCSINLSNSSFGNYGLVSRGASEVLYRGVVKKSAGRQITFKNLAKRPNIGDGVLFANYNQATCNRDNGLIVDSLAQDLLYEGTTQSTFAGLRYWAKGEITIGDQGPETVAALDHAKYIAGLITRDLAVTRTSGNTENQVRKVAAGATDGGSVTAQRLVRDGFAIVSGIVKNGPLSPQTVILPDYDLAEPELKRLREQVLNAKQSIQDETIAFIKATYPELQYSESKCFRDVGIIIDAVINDMIFGGNYLSIKAARTYISTSGLVIPSNTKTETIEAVKFARDKVIALIIENTDAVTRATANFALITSSIDAGVVTTTPLYPDYQDTDVTVKNLVTNLQANKTLVTQIVIAKVNENYPDLIGAYNQDTCKRDVAYVLDAMCFDLSYGGNSETLDAAKRYYSYANGSRQIANYERVATTDAYGIAQLYSQRVVINDPIEGYSGSQVLNGTATTQTQVNNLGNLFKIFLKQIDSEIVGTSDFIQPNGSRSDDEDLDNGYRLLQANKSFLKAEVIAYLTRSFPAFNYDRVKCARDIGYIVDSVCFDLVHSGNRQAVQSGIYYYGFSNESNVLKTVSPRQINQTINAYLYLKELLADVITCTPRPNPWQGDVEQRTSLPPATVAESYAINNLIDVIVEILREGPNNSEDSIQRTKQAIGLTASTDPNKEKAFNLLVANKQFIQAELSAYINLNWYEISDGDNTFARVSTATPLSLGTTTTGFPVTTYQPTAVKAARDAILAAKEDITTETTKFMANNFFDNFSFNKPKCYRDVGLILDAILSDMVFDSNYKTVNAAISYFRAYASDVIGPQKVQTVAALKATKILTLERIVTPAAKKAISTRFDILIDIIENENIGTNLLEYPAVLRNSDEDIDRKTAVDILRDNIDFIKEEVISYIDSNFTVLNYDREKCARDVGIIVEALGYDLMFGSNFRSITAGRSYMRVNAAKVVNGQKLATIGGFKHLRKLVAEIVKDNALAVNSTNRNMDIIIDIVESDGMNIPKFIIPFPATGRNVGYKRARDLVEKNRDFIISEILAYIDSPANETPVGYDEVKCERDLNLILDAVYYDTTYGGTLETQTAAYSYFVGAIKQLDPTGQNADEVAATIAAYTHLKSVISQVAVDTPVTRTAGNSTVQFRSPTGSDGSAAAATDISDLIQLIISYVDNSNADAGAVDIANLTSTPDLTWVDAKLVADFKKLQKATVTLKSAVTGYIDENFVLFGYNRATCARDVGLVVDAVRYDMMFGSNFQSIVAGQSYWRAQASVVTKDQKVATLAAFEFLKTKLLDLVKTNETATSRVTASMDGILAILENGLTATPTVIWPRPSGGSDNAHVLAYWNARNAIQSAKETIVTNINQWVIDQVGPSYPGFTYGLAQQANCKRDLRFIIDAITYDLTYGGAIQSDIAARAYRSGLTGASVLISNDVAITIAAYAELANQLATVVNDSGAGETRVSALANRISAIIADDDPPVAASLPSTDWVSNALITLDLSLTNNKSDLSSAVTDFVDSRFAYNKDKCSRDVGFLIDAMCYDVLYGGNLDTLSAAQSYFDGAVTPKSVIPKQVIQTVAAYERLKDVLQDVVQLKEVTPSSKKFLATERASANMDLIKNILDNGEAVAPKRPFALPLPTSGASNASDSGYLNARNLIEANREFIKAEVIAYIERAGASPAAPAGYKREICKRDIDYILDAIYYDLTYGGNMETVVAGLAYYAGDALGAGEQTATLAAYVRLKDVLIFVAQNTTFTPTTGNNVSQVFSTGTYTQVGSVAAVSTTSGLIDVITSFINGGSPSETTASTDWVDTGLVTISDALATVNAVTYTVGSDTFDGIQKQVTDYISANYPGLTYTVATCQRDIGLIIDAVRYDLMFGTNFRSTVAGRSYSRAQVTDGDFTSNNQKDATLAAIEFTKGKILEIIAANTVKQSTTSSSAGSSAAGTQASALIGKILTALNAGTPTVETPTTDWVSVLDNELVTISGNMDGDKATIKSAITDYIDANYFDLVGVYNPVTCQRDVGLVIDAVRYDMMFGSNFRTIVAARSYYRSQVVNGNFTSTNQKPATIRAFELLKNTLLTYTTTNDTAAARVAECMDIILSVLNNGLDALPEVKLPSPTGYNTTAPFVSYGYARNLIDANREFIKAELTKKITLEDDTLDYNSVTCLRDVDYIIDALRYDMTYGGSMESNVAALAYYAGAGLTNDSLPDADQLAVTKVVYAYLQTLVEKIAKNEDVSQLQVKVPQVFGPQAGVSAAQSAKNLAWTVRDYINPVASNAKTVFPDAAWTGTNLADFAELLGKYKTPNLVASVVDTVRRSRSLPQTVTNYAIKEYGNTVTSITVTGAGIVGDPYSATFTVTDAVDYTVGQPIQFIADDAIGGVKFDTTYYVKTIAGNNLSFTVSERSDRINTTPTTLTTVASITPVTGSLRVSRFDTEKCNRDTALVLDALRFDIAFDTNFKTIIAARAYKRSVADDLNATQKTATVESFKHLRQKLRDLNAAPKSTSKTAINDNGTAGSGNSGDTTTLARINTLMGLFIAHIESNTALPAKPYSIPTPTGANSLNTPLNAYDRNTLAARTAIENNREFIKAEVIAWIDDQNRRNTSGFTEFAYNRTKCLEDLDYILDAIYYDLTYGGNSETVNAGVAYYDGAVLGADEITATERAYDYLGTILFSIARNTPVDSFQLAVPQIRGIGGSAQVAAKLAGLTDVVINVVKGGVKQLPEPIEPEFLAGDETLAYVRSSLLEQKRSLQARIADYIDSFILQYSTEKCARDVGLIIDCVMYDLVLNSNFQSITAGSVYLQKAAGVVTSYQLGPQLEAINFIKEKCIAVSQTPPLVKNPYIIGEIENRFDIIYDIVDKGVEVAPAVVNVPPLGAAFNPNSINAAKSLIANKEFLKEEVTAYITANYKTYDQSRCARDVGLIIDAALNDLLLGTNYNSIKAGTAYRRATSSLVITDQLVETLGGIDYALSRVLELTTDATAIASITDSFELIKSIIAESTVPTFVTALAGGSVYALPRATGRDFRTIGYFTAVDYLKNSTNVAAIKAAVSAFIIEQIGSTAPSKNPAFTGFVYDTARQASCETDIGYILEAMCYDLTYGGNMETMVAGRAYYEGTIPNDSLTDVEVGATLEAYTFMAKYVFDGLVSSVSADIAREAEALILGVRNQIDAAYNSSPVTVTPYIDWVDSAYLSLDGEILTDKATITTDIVDAVSVANPSLAFDSAKCARDIGLVIDAVRYDLMFDTDFRSIVAGRSYKREVAVNVYDGGAQNAAELAALQSLRTKLVDLIDERASVTISDDAQAKVTALMNIIIGIVGGGAVPAVSALTTPTGGTDNAFNADIAKAKARIVANKAFLTEEVIAYIIQEKTANRGNFNNSYPGFTFTTGVGATDETKCREDLGFILDAIVYDLTYGGNMETSVAGRAYYNGTVLEDKNEKLATLDAYRHLRNIIKKVVKNDAVSVSTGNTASQVNGAAGTATSDTVRDNIVAPLVTLVMNYIDTAPQDPVEVSADIKWVPSKLYVFSDALNAAKATVAKTTTDYITANYPALTYNIDTCQRDIGLVIDAVRWDMMFNSNFRSNVAGRSYLRKQVTEGGFTSLGQKDASVAGFRIVKLALEDIVKSDATALARVGASMDVVIDVLETGPTRVRTFGGAGALALSIPYGGTVNSFDIGYLAARDRIEANRDFIKAQVVAYVDDNGPFNGYNEATCLRDVDYILDAVRYDLTYGGNLATIEAGRAYYDGTSFDDVPAGYRDDQIAATEGLYGYLATVLGSVAKNVSTGITYTGLPVSQVTTGLAGTIAGADAATALINELITYIGTSAGNNAAARLPNTSWVNSQFVSFATTMSDTVESLQQQVTDYVTATFPALTYNKTLCARDVGYVVDAVRYDMMFDNEFRSYVSGRSYSRSQVTGGNFTTLQQKAATMAAFKFLKDKLLAIVIGNKEAGRRVTSAMRTLLDTLELGEVTRNSYDAVIANGISLLDENRDSLLADMKAYLISNATSYNNDFDNYNELTCLRDIGYVLDAIKYDLTYGGNMETRVAGLAYYEGAELESGNSDHIAATKAAFTELSDKIAAITNFPVSVADRIAALIANVNSLIDDDTSGYPVYADASWADVNLKEVSAAFRDQIATIKTAVTTYVTTNFPALTYDPVKCARDVGYVTDAISWDMLFNSNFRTTIAGRSYGRLIAANGVFGTQQKAATTAAFNFLKDQLLALTTNTVAQERIAAGMNVILQILDKGLEGDTPALRWNASLAVGTTTARDNLLNNKDAIVADTIAYINTNLNPFKELDGSVGYNEEKCARDVGYIVNAVAYDMVTGGNVQSVVAGRRYLGNAAAQVLGAKEKHMTIQSLTYVKQLLATIVANNTTALTRVKANMDVVIGIINTGVVPALSFGTTATTLQTNRANRVAALDTAMADYTVTVDGTTFTWNTFKSGNVDGRYDTCLRDVGYVIDALTYDLTYGGNWASVIAARSYFAGVTAQLGENSAEVAATVEAYQRLKAVVASYVGGKTAEANDLIELIKTHINGGALATIQYPALLGVDNDLEIARNNLVNAESIVSKKTTKYINERAYLLYDIIKCERDLGFILDAVIYDSISGGNFQSLTAGRSYTRANIGDAVSAPQKFAILAALTHAKSVLANLVSTNSTLVTAIRTNLGIVIDIINDGSMDNAPAVNFGTIGGATASGTQSARASAKTSLTDGTFRTAAITAATDAAGATYSGLTAPRQEKCQRDLGYILDALVYDLFYGVNWASTIAARSYYEGTELQLGPVVAERTATLAALPALATSIKARAGVSSLTTEVDANIAIITDMLTANDGVVPSYTQPTFAVGTTNITPTLTDAFSKLVGTNNAIRDASVNKVLDYINSREFVRGVYNKTKCARDVELIIDAVAYDLALSSNFQSVKAGQAYLRSYSKTVTGEQKAATIGAMYFLKKSLSDALSAGSNRDKVRELMDTVIDILDRGVIAVPALTLATNATPAYANAIATITSKTSFIKAEIRAWIAIKYPELDYDKIACERDVDYILEALRYDLTYGGNSQTVEAGRSYWEGNKLSLGLGEDGVTELVATTDAENGAYIYLRDMIEDLIVESTFNSFVPKQVSVLKGTFGTTSNSTVQGQVVTLINGIINIIKAGSLGAANTAVAVVAPTYTSADADTLRGTKSSLPEDVTDAIDAAFLGQWFVYNQEKCERDLGYIVEALAYDRFYGGNSQTRDAGIQYTYKGGLVIPFGTKGPTILSMKNLATYITTTRGDSVAGALVTNCIVATLEKGLAGAPALVGPTLTKVDAKYVLLRDLVKDNLELIQEDTITYINEQYSGFGYLQETCKRDIGLTLDAVAYDLIYGGNSRTKYAAEQYFSGGRLQIPADSKDATAAGFNYLDTLARKIVKNDYVTPLQLYVDQNTDNVAATNSEVTTVGSLFDAFTDIVSNGYVSVVTLDATFKSSVDDNTYATFHQVSQITTTGHTLEWVGTGIDVDSALPYNGGVPIEANEIVSENGGFINFTSTDQKGDFKIGPELTIKRDSGSIVGRAFNKSLLGVITPYILALNE